MSLAYTVLLFICFLTIHLSSPSKATDVSVVDYWNLKFRNGPMPNFIQKMLKPHKYRYPLLWEELNSDVFSMNNADKLKYDKKCCEKTTVSLSARPQQTTYYLYHDLYVGKKFNIYFGYGGSRTSTFLPRRVVESIPFSTREIDAVFSYFSIPPDSVDADTVRETIEDCEYPPMPKEQKRCATSLESMIDFNIDNLGSEISVYKTEPSSDEEFTVVGDRKLIATNGTVCHKLRYPYAVYHCHVIKNTEVFTVSLVGSSGTKVKAVTICHWHTAGWSPTKHFFKTLKVLPGGPPICHFLSRDTLIWVDKPFSAIDGSGTPTLVKEE